MSFLANLFRKYIFCYTFTVIFIKTNNKTYGIKVKSLLVDGTGFFITSEELLNLSLSITLILLDSLFIFVFSTEDFLL